MRVLARLVSLAQIGELVRRLNADLNISELKCYVVSRSIHY